MARPDGTYYFPSAEGVEIRTQAGAVRRVDWYVALDGGSGQATARLEGRLPNGTWIDITSEVFGQAWFRASSTVGSPRAWTLLETRGATRAFSHVRMKIELNTTGVNDADYEAYAIPEGIGGEIGGSGGSVVPTESYVVDSLKISRVYLECTWEEPAFLFEIADARKNNFNIVANCPRGATSAYLLEELIDSYWTSAAGPNIYMRTGELSVAVEAAYAELNGGEAVLSSLRASISYRKAEAWIRVTPWTQAIRLAHHGTSVNDPTYPVPSRIKAWFWREAA